MRIIADKISTKYFTYDKENKTFSAEASDLPTTFNFYSRVFNDACDSGFTLISEKTGNEITFTFEKEDRQEGELMGTWFNSYSKDNSLKDIKVLIIND